MKREAIVIAGVLFGMVGMTAPASAQLSAKDLPQRTPQHDALAPLVGDWTIRGQTYKGSPYGEGKFTAKEHNEWMPGQIVLISRTQYSSLFKSSSQVAFLSVDPKTQKYTYNMQSSIGATIRSAGELRNKGVNSMMNNPIVWIEKEVNVEALGPGKGITYETEFVSPNEYRFKLTRNGEVTYDGVAKRVGGSRR